MKPDSKNSLETFHGYIETTKDSLLVFEACKRGIYTRVTKRIQEKERHLIRSGSVFCFDEKESGIKRWTDGRVWSPSRILGNFLIYRELEDRSSSNNSSDSSAISVISTPIGETSLNNNSSSSNNNDVTTAKGYVAAPDLLRSQKEKSLVGSLKSPYPFKRNGLIKKSISLIVDGVQQHIISYYRKEDVLSNNLETPSSIITLSSLQVSPSLYLRQNFRSSSLQSEENNNDGLTPRRHHNKRKYSKPTKCEDHNTTRDSPVSSISSDGEDSSVTFSPLDKLQQQHQQKKRHSSISISSNPNNDIDNLTKHISPNPSSHLALESAEISEKRNHSLDLDSYTATTNNKQTTLLPDKHYTIPEYSNHHSSTTAIAQVPCSAATTITEYLSNQTTVLPGSSKINSYATLGDKNHYSHTSQQHPKPATYYNRNEGITTATSFYPTNDLVSSLLTPNAAAITYHHSNNGTPHYSPFQDDYRQEQNPHQYLFSSSSLHAVNHATLPNRADPIANSFMVDINMLLGIGWNDFELQM